LYEVGRIKEQITFFLADKRHDSILLRHKEREQILVFASEKKGVVAFFEAESGREAQVELISFVHWSC
jgi:hypothetical protein